MFDDEDPEEREYERQRRRSRIAVDMVFGEFPRRYEQAFAIGADCASGGLDACARRS